MSSLFLKSSGTGNGNALTSIRKAVCRSGSYCGVLRFDTSGMMGVGPNVFEKASEFLSEGGVPSVSCRAVACDDSRMGRSRFPGGTLNMRLSGRYPLSVPSRFRRVRGGCSAERRPGQKTGRTKRLPSSEKMAVRGTAPDEAAGREGPRAVRPFGNDCKREATG